MTIKKITEYLKSELKINFIKIYNQSLIHNRSKKNITHLIIIIVSNDFINKKLIDRHRMIFSILEKEKIYSITLHTYTSDEWKNIECKNFSSPQCLKN